jgi:SAM-dependent methyltransferase
MNVRAAMKRLLPGKEPTADVQAPASPFLRPGEKIRFTCNICGGESEFPLCNLQRETASCGYCNSTPRFRSIIHALSIELFGESLAIRDFPNRRDLRGIGFSEVSDYPKLLAERLDYHNTWFHQEPRLDITKEYENQYGAFDFVICSEVLEHIQPPVQPAFETMAKLLKPGGVLILSVPHYPGPTVEHFPRLHDFRIIEEKGVSRLENTTATGVREHFNNLVFHGGPGAALEMRLFGRDDVERHVRDSGLRFLRYFTEAAPACGVVGNHLYYNGFVGMEQPPWSARTPNELA